MGSVPADVCWPGPCRCVADPLRPWFLGKTGLTKAPSTLLWVTGGGMASLRFLVRRRYCHRHWLSWSNCWWTVDAAPVCTKPVVPRASGCTGPAREQVCICSLACSANTGHRVCSLQGSAAGGGPGLDFGERGSSSSHPVFVIRSVPLGPEQRLPAAHLKSGIQREPRHSWGALRFSEPFLISPEEMQTFLQMVTALRSLGKIPSARRVL